MTHTSAALGVLDALLIPVHALLPGAVEGAQAQLLMVAIGGAHVLRLRARLPRSCRAGELPARELSIRGGVGARAGAVPLPHAQRAHVRQQPHPIRSPLGRWTWGGGRGEGSSTIRQGAHQQRRACQLNSIPWGPIVMTSLISPQINICSPLMTMRGWGGPGTERRGSGHSAQFASASQPTFHCSHMFLLVARSPLSQVHRIKNGSGLAVFGVLIERGAAKPNATFQRALDEAPPTQGKLVVRGLTKPLVAGSLLSFQHP